MRTLDCKASYLLLFTVDGVAVDNSEDVSFSWFRDVQRDDEVTFMWRQDLVGIYARRLVSVKQSCVFYRCRRVRGEARS